MAEQLLVGDVTAVSEYAELAAEVINKKFTYGHTERVKEMERKTKIKRVRSNPFTYVITQAILEDRWLTEHSEPSEKVPSTAEHICHVNEFDKRYVKASSIARKYSTKEHVSTVDDSVYYEICDCCNGGGKIGCACKTGIATCYDCEGEGKVKCRMCYGTREISCHSCGGTGSNWENGKKVECSSCRGRGYEDCGYCGYSGYVRCDTCDGQGELVCGKCNGTLFVTCQNCTGLGGFLHTVQVHQKFELIDKLRIVNGYDVNRNMFEKTFDRFTPEPKKDILLKTYDGLTEMRSVLEDNIISNITDRVEYMEDVDYLTLTADSSKHIMDYRIHIYQRNVLHIQFEYNSKIYNMIYDASTDKYIIDKDPYSELAYVLGKGYCFPDEAEEVNKKAKEEYKKRQEELEKIREEKEREKNIIILWSTDEKKIEAYLERKNNRVGRKYLMNHFLLAASYGCLANFILNLAFIQTIICLILLILLNIHYLALLKDFEIINTAKYYIKKEYSKNGFYVVLGEECFFDKMLRLRFLVSAIALFLPITPGSYTPVRIIVSIILVIADYAYHTWLLNKRGGLFFRGVKIKETEKMDQKAQKIAEECKKLIETPNVKK